MVSNNKVSSSPTKTPGLSGALVWWLAQELRNKADAVGPVPDLVENNLRHMADQLEAGTWGPFHLNGERKVRETTTEEAEDS